MWEAWGVAGAIFLQGKFQWLVQFVLLFIVPLIDFNGLRAQGVCRAYLPRAVRSR
jgi:hypothetical protein